MNIIELIEQKYGDTCRLRSPLTKNQCEKAKKISLYMEKRKI